MSSRRCDCRIRASLLVMATLASLAPADIGPLSAASQLTEEIVQKLTAANAQRAQALRSYRGKRIYHLEYSGLFGHHEAEVQVEASYTAPDKKDFRITSESGSKLLINRVLRRVLSSEEEAQKDENRVELEISPRNYEFSLDEIEHTSDGDYYVLNVSPKGRSKYLYRGKIWVDAHDFAITRMEGEPLKNPSIWVSHTRIEYRWAKEDGFWLPVENRSVTQVRMGGRAVLNIDYVDYQVTPVSRVSNGEHSAATQALPAPATVTADPH